MFFAVLISAFLITTSSSFAAFPPDNSTQTSLTGESIDLLNSFPDPDDMTMEEMAEYLEVLKTLGLVQENPYGSQRFAQQGGSQSMIKVTAHVACDPADGKFYMSVYIGNQLSYRWLTSPGQKKFPTEIPQGETAKYTTKMHVTSERTDYPGIPMPHAVWFIGGYATHGTKEIRKLGYPASHGCLRLSNHNAATFFDLTNEVGTKNVSMYVTLNYDCGRRQQLPRQEIAQPQLPWQTEVRENPRRNRKSALPTDNNGWQVQVTPESQVNRQRRRTRSNSGSWFDAMENYGYKRQVPRKKSWRDQIFQQLN